MNGMAIVQKETQYLEQYMATKCVSQQPFVVRVVSWAPLPTMMYKIYVDGAVFSTQKAIGVGVLIHDDSGQVIATLSQKIFAITYEVYVF